MLQSTKNNGLYRMCSHHMGRNNLYLYSSFSAIFNANFAIYIPIQILIIVYIYAEMEGLSLFTVRRQFFGREKGGWFSLSVPMPGQSLCS